MEKTASLLILLALSVSAIAGVQLFVNIAVANPVIVPPVKMPEEYISVKISLVNETLWAKVEGTYYLQKFDTGSDDPRVGTNGGELAYVGDTQNTRYPVPPDATNIAVKMDQEKLNWTDFTKTVPEATYNTILGNWSYITWRISPIPDSYMIETSYEHPVPIKDGNYTFLYPLITDSFLSPWGDKTTAHISIRVEINYTNLNVFTVSSEASWNLIEYTTKKDNTSETITFQLISEYSKPRLGDIVITIAEPKAVETEFPYLIIIPLLALTVTLIALLAIIYRKRTHKRIG